MTPGGWGWLVLSLVLVSPSCSSKPESSPIGEPVEIEAPLGLPTVPYPADNPPTAETIALGRRLFFDTALSADDTVSCATCHDPKLGLSDAKPRSGGIGGRKAARNSPTVWNAAYHETQFHDGRALTLEEQVEGPVTNPVEMGNTAAGAVEAIAADASYGPDFERAFGPGPITFEKIAKAIAAFERTLVSGDSPFDRYRFAADESALSESAKRGWEFFRDPERGNCTICHLVGAHSAPLTDHLFHNLGVGVDSEGDLMDLGRYAVTGKDRDKGAFKTPTLRNVELTAPYMHDGSLAALDDVLNFYAIGGGRNAYLDPEMKPVALSPRDREDLIEFLRALTSARAKPGA